jgi:UDPglucose 6-dehydrogenase
VNCTGHESTGQFSWAIHWPDSDDIRDSPALDVSARIHLEGLSVLGYAASARDAVCGAHLVLHLTEWQEFRNLDPPLAREISQPRIVDGRGALDGARWAAAEWTVCALGRPAHPHAAADQEKLS